MGCECSTLKENLAAHEFITAPDDPHEAKEVPHEKIPFKELTTTLHAIKKNDPFLANKLLKSKNSETSLTVGGSSATYLHYAAKFNSYKSMGVFLLWINKFKPNKVEEIINAQDANGRTAAMVCALYDAGEALYVLLQSGHVKEELRDIKCKTLADLCEDHSKSCMVILKKVKELGKNFSLTEAILSVQRVHRVTKFARNTVVVLNASRKFLELTTRKSDQSEAESPRAPTSKSRRHRGKLSRNFDNDVVWCKHKRSPSYDIRYQKNVSRFVTINNNHGHSIYSLPTMHNKNFKANTLKIPIKKVFSQVDDFSMYQDIPLEINENIEEGDYYDSSNDGNESEEYREDDEDLELPSNILLTTDVYMKTEGEEDYEMRKYSQGEKEENEKSTELILNYKTHSILERLRSKNENFKDESFPPDDTTLGPAWIQKNSNLKITWQRPHQFLGVDYPKIFLFNKIDPHDIEQGRLGVCYLLAAVSAVAEFPSRVQKIFINETSNAHGVYGVKFYVKGIPTEVVIDDFIPCTKEKPQQKICPVFSKPKENELWVLLLEKAWAKLFGSYSVVETGVSDEAFEYTLGVPSVLYLTSNQTIDKIWKKIYDADKKNYVISASTIESATGEVGLAASHTYSVISAHEIAGFRLLKIRNPWGRFEWKGDFSDYSPLWTPQIKKEVGYVKAEDGMFCMTVEDFKEYFMGYVIAEYHEDWHYSYIQGNNKYDRAQYFKFVVKYPTEIYLRVHQNNERLRSIKGYASVDFRIARLDEKGGYSFVVYKTKDVDDTAIFGHHTVPISRKQKIYLKKPGVYFVRVKMRWGNLEPEPFTLSAYSPYKINFQPIEPIKGFLQKAYLNLGQRAKHKEEIENGCFIARGFSGFNHYIYAENNGNKIWSLSMTFSKVVNVKFGKPFRIGNNAYKMVLAPGDRKTTYFTIEDVQSPSTYINPTFHHKWT